MPSALPSSPQSLTPIRVLVPGTGTRFRCGGLGVALQTARLLSQLRPTQVVTYRQRQDDHPFLMTCCDRRKLQPMPSGW